MASQKIESKTIKKTPSKKRPVNHVKKANNLAQEIIAYGVAVLVAMVMVYVIVAEGLTLTGINASYIQLPAGIISIISGLGTTYAVATNKKVRTAISKWVNDKL